MSACQKAVSRKIGTQIIFHIGCSLCLARLGLFLLLGFHAVIQQRQVSAHTFHCTCREYRI